MRDQIIADYFGVLLVRRQSDGALYFAMYDHVADQCFESREQAEELLRYIRDRMAKKVLTILDDDPDKGLDRLPAL